MTPKLSTGKGDGKPVFKGWVSIGKNWLFYTYGKGELYLTEEHLELRLPWKKVRLAWSDVSNIRVRYGTTLYIAHNASRVAPYLVFLPVRSDPDWQLISDLTKEHGFPIQFISWF